MYACPRDCGGSVVADREGITTCTLCARGEVLARPPTAQEVHSRGKGMTTETNYLIGIYAIDYVPTQEELSRAAW